MLSQRHLRRRSAWFATSASGALAVAALAAFGSGAGDASAKAAATPKSAAKPVLTYGMVNFGASLDPTTANAPNSQIQVLVNEPLIYNTSTGVFVPGLAEKWGYVGKGTKTFSLTLRHGMKFDDGTPVTAAAVKTWLLYFSHSHSEYADQLKIASITTKGSWTDVIHLKIDTPDIPAFFSNQYEAWGAVCSPKALKNPQSMGAQPDGVGEYVPVSSQTVTGSSYTFVPNKNFYDQSAIKYSKVEVKIITNPASMLAAIKSGQLDVASGDPTTAKAAQAAGLKVVQAPTGWDGIFFFDKDAAPSAAGQTNPLAKLDVRRALNYAVNRSAITKAILGGDGIPTSEGPSTDGYDPRYKNYYAYNPVKAKALLKAAGYPNGFTMTVISQSWWGTIGDEFLEAVAQDLKAVGVTLTLKTGYTNSQWNAAAVTGDYLASGFVQTPLIPTVQWYDYFLGPKALLNEHGYDDSVMDSLYQKGISAGTQAAADRYWKKMMDRVVTQADELVVFEEPSYWYVAKGTGGVHFTSGTGYPYPTDWYPTN